MLCKKIQKNSRENRTENSANICRSTALTNFYCVNTPFSICFLIFSRKTLIVSANYKQVKFLRIYAVLLSGLWNTCHISKLKKTLLTLWRAFALTSEVWYHRFAWVSSLCMDTELCCEPLAAFPRLSPSPQGLPACASKLNFHRVISLILRVHIQRILSEYLSLILLRNTLKEISQIFL